MKHFRESSLHTESAIVLTSLLFTFFPDLGMLALWQPLQLNLLSLHTPCTYFHSVNCRKYVPHKALLSANLSGALSE